MKAHRILLPVVALGVLALTGIALASALEGPKRVEPGTQVEFKGKGLAPKSSVDVSAQEKSYVGTAGNGAVGVKGDFKTNRKGRVTLRFKFPKAYYVETGPQEFDRVPWRDGDRAHLTACDNAGGGCATRYVEISK